MRSGEIFLLSHNDCTIFGLKLVSPPHLFANNPKFVVTLTPFTISLYYLRILYIAITNYKNLMNLLILYLNAKKHSLPFADNQVL